MAAVSRPGRSRRSGRVRADEETAATTTRGPRDVLRSSATTLFADEVRTKDRARRRGRTRCPRFDWTIRRIAPTATGPQPASVQLSACPPAETSSHRIAKFWTLRFMATRLPGDWARVWRSWEGRRRSNHVWSEETDHLFHRTATAVPRRIGAVRSTWGRRGRLMCPTARSHSTW